MIPFILAAVGGYLIGDSVSEKFANGGLIAPNGKPSNLTPEQYKLVRTPEFKAWFGDWENNPEDASKVVDSNGEPLVVYHGGVTRFNIFSEYESGYYFTDNKAYANNYAELGDDGYLFESFLKINKFIDATHLSKISGYDIGILLKKYGIVSSKNIKETFVDFDKITKYKTNSNKNYFWLYLRHYLYDFVSEVSHKYDGIILNEYDTDNNIIKVFVCFNNNQIKLADGSNTTFDSSNPDIRYAKGGSTKEIICPFFQLSDEIISYVKQFNTDEIFLIKGGLSTEMLDRLAFGFADSDIKTLNPNELSIKWKEDLINVKYEIQKSGLKPKIWAEKINLTEPIDVSYEKNKFYIEDGHHRYTAAKILNKPLNVNLEIKSNPIKKIAPKLSYDNLMRCIFKQVHKK